MYRLLKSRCVVISNKYSSPLQTNLYPSTKVCTFCSFYHPKNTNLSFSHLHRRHQTTTIHTALLNPPVPKKIKTRRQRYAELLEVSDSSTRNHKAFIKKLDADQLSLLIDEPDFTLDKIYWIEEGIHRLDCTASGGAAAPKRSTKLRRSENELTNTSETGHEKDYETAVLEDLQESGVSDQAALIKHSSFLQSLRNEVEKEEILEDDGPSVIDEKVEKSKNDPRKGIPKNQHISMKGRIERLNRTYASFVQVCITVGMVSRAFQTVSNSRKRTDREKKKLLITSPLVYNELLHAYAATKNVRRIKEILAFMKEDSIAPTVQTYAAVFEVFGRLRKPHKEKEFLETIKADMEASNITFDDIVKTAIYAGDQRECVMKTVKMLQPNYQRIDDPPDYLYDCPLLKTIDPTKTNPKPSPAENMFTLEELKKRMEEQLKYETRGHIEVKSIEKIDELKPSTTLCREIVSNLEKSWYELASKAFDRDLVNLRSRMLGGYQTMLFPYLFTLDKEIYIKTMLRDARRLADGSETFSPSLTSLQRELGSQIYALYELAEKERAGTLKTIEQAYTEFCEWYLKRDGKYNLNSRAAWQNIALKYEKTGPSLESRSVPWPANICADIGKFLYNIILKDLKLDINCIKPNPKQEHFLPAFYLLYRTKGKHFKEELKPHPLLAKLYRDSQPEALTFETALLPSVCPPKPWTNVRAGGYLVAKCDVIRVPQNAMQQWNRIRAAPEKQLWPALDSLNQLASIPWSVNNRVLDVIIKVFREGGSVKLNVPQPPSVLPVPSVKTTTDKKEIINIIKARIDYRRRKGEMYSLWCDLLYRLSLANHYRDKVFWLPHNMDFRGRVYPIPPHLNHLGSDLARSILTFAQGKPLGPNGLDWLKIHVINLTGFKKRDPISERLKYANENMDNILDSANNPLEGKMWWTTSDEPWQTLAACMEISEALKADCPREYVSKFPIHQDGSCNGLQHYAALGRDRIGAESVNLHPFDSPRDVYSSVATMVDSKRQYEASNGLEIARVLEGFVTRKVIKQTVMTTVYGVTKFGARLQIARQLKDMENFPQEHVWSASMYLVQKTFESLSTMFQSAREIQDWFTECARIISINCGRGIEWVTPLGLPIVQPYTKVGKNEPYLEYSGEDRPNTMKQKNAFPPNFVHSLDSSHMMLTGLHCEHAGLTFMSVHDCYWTHPCTVETMNKICREQFVALHSQPILEDLSKFLLKEYGFEKKDSTGNYSMGDIANLKVNHTLCQVPKKGDFDLEGVRHSTYFFS